jgi:DNA topoisomerase-1
VQHGKTYANLTTGDDVLAVGLNRAVTLIEEKKAKGPRKGRFGADPGRALGDHPDKGGPIVVKNGRYGPYVSHDGVNATLPTDMTPDAITLEQAVGLIDARAARGGGGKKPAIKARSSGRAETPAKPRSTARKAPAKAKAAPKPPVVAEKKPARKAKVAK